MKKCKENMLEHILYEIDNYIYSYRKQIDLLINKNNSILWQNEYNLSWVVHRVSLRNLISFFDWKNQKWFDDKKSNDDISDIKYQYFDFAYTKEAKLTLKSSTKGKLSRFLNKSIFHLTEERFLENSDNGIDNYLAKEIHNIYKIIKNSIVSFLNSLLLNNKITYKNQITNIERTIDDEVQIYRKNIKNILQII